MRPRYAIRDCAAFKQSVRQVRCSCNSQIGIANQTKCGLTTFAAVARKKGTEMVAIPQFQPVGLAGDKVQPDESDRNSEAFRDAVRLAGQGGVGKWLQPAPGNPPGEEMRGQDQ